jgi:hypothetical protein
VSRAVASLLAASVFAIAALGVLIIWHLVRRGRLIREGLDRPRPVRWPAVEPIERNPGTRHRADTNEIGTDPRTDPDPGTDPESERRES